LEHVLEKTIDVVIVVVFVCGSVVVFVIVVDVVVTYGCGVFNMMCSKP